jgi:hypothetical protein
MASRGRQQSMLTGMRSQDENKKLEETEKKARTIVNERLDSLLYDIQDVMASKGNPRNEKVDIDLDEA